MNDSKEFRMRLSRSRRILENPYAYDDGTGNFKLHYEAATGQTIPKRIADSRRLLQNPHAYDDGDSKFEASLEGARFGVSPQGGQYHATNRGKRRYADDQIEEIARKLQVDIWKRRKEIWPEVVPSDPLDVLDPEVALQYIGFEFHLSDFLGSFSERGEQIEVAGLIDRAENKVEICRNLPRETHRFTIAHELGHALMHTETRLHRDQPLDRPNRKGMARSSMEREADKFAAFFLLPGKQVKKRLTMLFGCTNFFELNDDHAFGLAPSDPDRVIERCKTTRDLARVLAKAQSFGGRHFHSLADQFGVSAEAMAIRLEELGLVRL